MQWGVAIDLMVLGFGWGEEDAKGVDCGGGTGKWKPCKF